MTTYYTWSGTPIAGSRGVSSLFRTEFTSVQTAFATVNSEMVLKAPLNSPAFTDTPTAPTASAGTSTTQIATTAFVAGTAFSSALPAQTGNSGKSIVTDGATASWGVSGVAGGGTGISSYTVGDMLYASGATELSKLAASTAGYVLTSGGAGFAPTWVSAFPDQTNNAGKFLKTNGTTPSWDYAGISTVGSTVTDNYTITSTTPTIYPCATTAIGKCITAPAVDANTPLGLFTVIDNKRGGYPVGYRDSTGTLVGAAVAAGGIAQVYLEDNSTAAGTWRMVGTNLEPGLITIDSTFSSTYASTVLAPFVALDSNTSIHFAALSSGFAAFVVDNTGKAITSPVTVATGAAFVPRTAFKVSSTSAIVFYDAVGGTAYAVVLTLSGSSPSYSLSVGTAATSADPNSFNQENFTDAPKVAQLSSTLYVYSYTRGTNTSVVAVSVSGVTVTIGTAANIITASSVSSSTTTYALTATTALVLYKSGAGAPYANNAVVVSVSGTTCTVGTPAVVTGVGSNNTNPCGSVLLSATKALVSDDNQTSNAIVAAVTISGTSVSVGAALTVAATTANDLVHYTASSATRYNPHLFALSPSTALFWFLNSAGVSHAVVLSESGGTVTKGAILYRSISTATSGSAGFGAVNPQGTSEFCAITQIFDSTAGYSLKAISHKISGTSVIQGASKDMGVQSTNPLSVSVSRLSSGKYVCTGLNDNATNMSGIAVWGSNGDVIYPLGAIAAPPLNTGLQLNSAISSNRLVILGGTLRGTTVGASTYQLRLLNVEICA